MIDFIFRLGLMLPNFGLATKILKVFGAVLRSKYQRRKILKTSIDRPSVLIFALPKSGSTWLEGMLGSVKGYNLFMPWQASIAELKFGRSDDYNFNKSHLRGVLGKATITKIHSRPNSSVIEAIRQLDRPYIVLVRNLDEIMESHTHYARRTRFHPDFPMLRNVSFEMGCELVREKYFEDFSLWRKDWEGFEDENKQIVDYEDLINSCELEMKRITSHLGINLSPREIKMIIELNTIKNLRRNSVHKEFFRGSRVE